MTDRKVLITKIEAAASPKNAICCWKLIFDSPKTESISETLLPGCWDCTPVTASAPKTPKAATPIKSKNPRLTCITMTAIILGLSDFGKILVERITVDFVNFSIKAEFMIDCFASHSKNHVGERLKK